jgi:membrane protein implicated in regulation of membrane protease activity
MNPEPDPLPWGQILFFGGCAVMLVIAFLHWMRSAKKVSAYRQHYRKTQRGLKIAKVERHDHQSGRVDWYVHYSDGSVIKVIDEHTCPVWAIPET